MPKHDKMLVPARIIASENLLKSIQQDTTLQQLKNTASLKGIVKHALAMPDAHQGYGFPIGGVAAFDVNEGIISPGGVGYDINCLSGDAKVLNEFGAYEKIERFEQRATEEICVGNVCLKGIKSAFLKTLNRQSKSIESRKINLFLKKESQDLFEIKTKAGFSIKATGEHPILANNGMVIVNNLKKSDLIAVKPFEGVEFEAVDNQDFGIYSKLLGYCLGDGCFYFSRNKNYVVFYGGKEDLKNIQDDIAKLGFNSHLYSRNRNHRIKTQYGEREFNAINHELHINTAKFSEMLQELGMPKGNKTRQEYRVPEWIKCSPLWIKRLFLAGFFGAELSTPRMHTKTGFNMPIVSQNKIEQLAPNARLFMSDIACLLNDFGIKISKISQRQEFKNKFNEKTIRCSLMISGNEENLLKLWQNIGFEYNQKRTAFAEIASLYIRYKKRDNLIRHNIAEKVKEYKKANFKLKEVYVLLEKELLQNLINKRFIERSYYKSASQRINLSFISFKEFLRKKLEEFEKYGCLFDEIESIKSIKGKFEVYDFNMEDNHNFIANSIIVSNCGVRMLSTSLNAKDIESKRKQLLDQLFRDIPSGVGKTAELKLSESQLDEVMTEGVQWAEKNNYANKNDLKHCEEYGKMHKADPNAVSQRAVKRGKPQLGTLGAGNHFIEIQKVDEIYDEKIAKAFGINQKDQVVVMIHSGSRGFGHQIASDYIKEMEEKYGIAHLPDRELVNAPINSDLGQKYYSAMACAINFAFANRQLMTYWTRQAFKKVLNTDELSLIYDVCHNLAKFEKHKIENKIQNLCMHRKGATRSFGPGRDEVPETYRSIGQPVIIPGSMGTASYILVGTNESEEVSFSSTAHGAGRLQSRHAALKSQTSEQVVKNLQKKNIEIKGASKKGIAEEAPEAYKDIDEVIEVSHNLKIGNKVAKLKPFAVMKG